MIFLLMHILHPDDGKMADESRDHQLICTPVALLYLLPSKRSDSRPGVMRRMGFWRTHPFDICGLNGSDRWFHLAACPSEGTWAITGTLSGVEVWKAMEVGRFWQLCKADSLKFCCVFWFICSWDTVETSWNCKDLWLQFLSLAAMSHGVAAVEIQTEEVLMFELVGSKPWTWMT